MSRNILSDILGGQVLVMKGGLIRHWKFVLFVFALVIFYISLNFWMRNTKQRIVSNNETIRDMRSEYMGKYAEILNLGKRGEIEKLIEKESLELIPPVTPPARVKMERD